MKDTLEEQLSPPASRLVAIHNDPAKGIIETCRSDAYELLVMGATRLGARGELRTTGVPRRVLEARPDVSLMVVRDALPLGSRLKRWMQLALQRHVPQLMRADRIDLVERIQSNAQWNFDFMLLIALSTLIAPPLLQAPAGLVQAVENRLVDDEFRLRRIRLLREHGALNMQVDVGGSRLPDAMLQQSLAELAREHLGEESGVRLTFRYETLVK